MEKRDSKYRKINGQRDLVDQGDDYGNPLYRQDGSYGGVPEQGHQYEEDMSQRPPKPVKYPVSDRKPMAMGLYGNQ